MEELWAQLLVMFGEFLDVVPYARVALAIYVVGTVGTVIFRNLIKRV